MTYQVLDEAGVAAYVADHGFLDGPLTVEEVGDGNVNHVFIVRGPGGSMVVKQALPYLRVAGEGWPLTRDRMRFEIGALELYNTLVPGRVPSVVHADEPLSLVVMEHLANHRIMRFVLLDREPLPHFVDHITTFLANTLYRTSDLHLAGPEKKALQAKFINPALCKLQEDFVYTNPFTDSPENQWNPLLDELVAEIRADGELKLGVLEMKHHYTTHAEALIHGDLHTGSIMLNASDTRVIDPEFAFYGPMAYDLAAVMQNLVLNYLSHAVHSRDAAYREGLLEMVRGVWLGFVEKFDAMWVRDPWLDGASHDRLREATFARLLQEVAGHGGTKFLRRMMGIVSVPDVSSIADPQARADVERRAIQIGRSWVLDRRSIGSVDDLIERVTRVDPL